PFVYGFLGDVNLFHGRAHDGALLLDGSSTGFKIDTPEQGKGQDVKAYAYVRPHDFEVQRWASGAEGIPARISRAIVVGPIARLELEPEEDTSGVKQGVIEVQLPAAQYRELGLKEGELLAVTPRKARVFVEGSADLATPNA